ncbi:MAG: carboxypeptidase regulatory-like domain-containing protein [Sporichthyaceae bacterium]|nr:carboxypeptidase regulatory-like domain-containing protein [Sporichthyaceae bacterium]
MAALAALLTVTTTIAALGTSASAEDSMSKVEAKVLDQINQKGQTTFWALLRTKADLSAAPTIQNSTERGQFVYDELHAVADRTQAGLRDLLAKQGADFTPYWIANAVQITADESVLEQVAALPEVERVLAERVYQAPKPDPVKELNRINAVEWNLDRVRAPEVWSTFGVRGEGIVVANVDSGVQFDHPALVGKYRGNLGGGVFDHNYNWFDPSNVCGNPSTAPCDNNGHGTHTMGTMVGDDGGANQIGVAPGARWIAAKGCETNTCSDAALLASGQWIVAPTDLNGQNPRPDLAPDIVNNSWGGPGNDPWYQATVSAWLAAGIYPQFSNGNNGPGCNTSGSPGDYVSSYSAGAFDINNVIASFSSRGASAFGGEIKPNIAAPGVAVRSSVPTNSYAAANGTSMASPHVAATVALMWSAAPALSGDITATRTLLDDTAIDTTDLTCGGTADDNNVWGEGRLDAFAAVEQSPRGALGSLSGTVTDANTSAPLSGVTVSATGPIDRTTMTGSDGTYSFPALSTGDYQVSASLFGYATGTANVTVTEGTTVTQNFALVPAGVHTVSGRVLTTTGSPVPNATVTILGTPIAPATTDATGAYSFPAVPAGEYDIQAVAGKCTSAQTQHLVVDGNETLDFAVVQRQDSFGYFCVLQTPGFIEAGTVLPLTGDDASTTITLPFAFPFYGQNHTTAHVSTNGNINFVAPSTVFGNVAIPATAAPNGAIYSLWDDIVVDGGGSVRTASLGSAPNRSFVIEWRDVRFIGDATQRVDFEIVLRENGQILTQYRNISPTVGREQGNLATLGIENQTGTVAFQYSFNEAVIQSPTFAVLYRLPPNGTITGTVTDANDDLPIAGATVAASQGGTVVKQTTTNANGAYQLQLGLGTYTVAASATNYATASAEVVLDEDGEFVTQNFALETARAEVSPTSLQVIAPTNQTRNRVLTLSNTGGLDLTWSIPASGAPWLAVSPTGGTLAPGGSQALQLTIDTTGLAPGVYSATLAIQTNSGRQPTVNVPVTLVVPAYYQAVNAGGNAYTDGNGDLWSADQKHTVGSWGYTGNSSSAQSTNKPIAGTTDDILFQNLRRDPVDYRFDNVPNGVYEIDVRFAEIGKRKPNTRLFDVIAEQNLLLPAHDIAGEVGTFTADQHVFFVTVTDGQLNLRFIERRGFNKPIVNAILIRHRPDR